MKNNKIWTAVLSVVIALGLWFYVVTVVKPESTNTYYNIPVALQGESLLLTERNLVIVDGKDSTVTMELFGNRTDLDKVNSGNITLIADLTKIYNAGEIELPYTYRFPGDVPSGALSVQSQTPGTIKLKVENWISKPVDVVPVWTGEMPDKNMYIVDTGKYELDTSTIHVAGPESVIDQIHHAVVEVDLTGQTETLSETYRIKLCDEEGNGVDVSMVKPSVEEVRVTLPIRYFRYIPMHVSAVAGGGATQETSSIVYDPTLIMVSGNKNVLSKMTVIELGSVNLAELTESMQKRVFPIHLDEGLFNESGETECTVTISFPNLATQEVTVTEIQVLNVPEGLEYELRTKELTVRVRGPKDVVTRVKPSHLTVTIDLANAVVGTATYTPVITVDETKCPGVGAIGQYNISATLQDAVAVADVTTPG